MHPLSKDCINKVDPLAQSVEHNTFNVGVLGSSPKRITDGEVGLLPKTATTAYLLRVVTLESEKRKMQNK